MIEITLLTRAACCLCDQMQEAVVPVLLINGCCAYKYRVNQGVRRRLRGAARCR